jgi:hypothetical protein
MLDLLEQSWRRALNLAFNWLVVTVDHETWKKEFAPVFARTMEDDEREREAQERWAPEDESGQGEFILVRNDDVEPGDQPRRAINFPTVKPPAGA